MRLAILSLLFAACLSFAQSERPTKKTDQPQTSQSPPKIDFWFIPMSPDPNAAKKQQTTHDESHYGDSATWALVIVGIGGVGAALWTLAIIKRQTKAIEDQVGVLINSERAWVVVSKIQFTRLTPDAPVDFGCEFKNCGRTVARLTGPFKWQCAALRGLDRMPDIPDYSRSPTFSPDTPESPIRGRVVAPGDTHEPGAPLACSDPAITATVLAEINSHTARLYFYASITYFDFANVERELQFCYNYMPSAMGTAGPGNWVLAGPREYNKHT